MSLLALVTLSACMNADGSTNASSKEENEAEQTANTDEKFAQLENEFDAQLGVYTLDTSTNQTIEYRPEKRFAFASTYKALAAAIVLQQKSKDDLKEVITYTEDDLVSYSPVTKEHVDTGMTLLELSEAAVRTSDNTAGNLLFKALGGPGEFEQALRQIGDSVTQADRYEPDLNEFTPGDTRDTSTPKALATSLKAFAVGDLLSNDKRELFTDWLQGNATGDGLIRAGAPEGWVVGDKSGAASYGTRNDIAVVWPPNREPIVIAIMSHLDKEDAQYNDALIAQAAEVALNALK
ncbi:class A beta-lactamase [Halobacillus shinanisalinarum]|uniref:Beta-lactamase n=2 Tax=Halobacillus shinanisalinarum TaxID=2932258 RepID=A0ABY4H5G4_9BACI|nr:class A beta-lactamase [Halobacillus shinanisalinarum]UOQ95712.1 class A beta-lactamase [Halobacillus shinanisalinarum]